MLQWGARGPGPLNARMVEKPEQKEWQVIGRKGK